jgi:hypothetical protein
MTADGATCDPPDPEDKYRMRPREEVEKENPELAALLKKHANENNEIMLTLANGIMICKNATICWWNGRCPDFTCYRHVPCNMTSCLEQQAGKDLWSTEAQGPGACDITNSTCRYSAFSPTAGGNILESFLTILKHTNVTNHLIGVMDDETEQYLKGRCV